MAIAFAEYELRLYQRIRPEEFVEKVVKPGSPEAPNVKCRHLVAMINWANKVGGGCLRGATPPWCGQPSSPGPARWKRAGRPPFRLATGSP